MWVIDGNRASFGAIRTLEERLRLEHECGAETEVEHLEKQLDKALKEMHERTVDRLFGPGAIATATGTHTLATFFTRTHMCLRCEKNTAKNEHLCPACGTLRETRCLAPGCRKAVLEMEKDGITPARYCFSCKSVMGTCPKCGRAEQRMVSQVGVDAVACESCAANKCYACGKKVADGGACDICRPFVAAPPSRVTHSSVDIEDLARQAEAAKRECVEQCGRASDDISCVSRECAVLYKRVTIAARMRAIMALVK